MARPGRPTNCPIVLIVSLWLFIPTLAQAAPSQYSLTELRDWQYRWGDSPKAPSGVPRWARPESSAGWTATTLPGLPPGRHGRRYLWERVRLPRGNWRDPTVFIPGILLDFEAYLDGKLIYATGNLDTAGRLRLADTPWHMLPLPPDSAGALLTFRIRSSYYLIGIDHLPLIGSRAQLITHIVRTDAIRLIIAVICVFLALLALAVWIGRVRQAEYLAFAAFALLVTIHILHATYTKQLLLPRMVGWTHLWLISLLLIPLAILAFVDLSFGPGYAKSIKRCWQLHSLIAPLLIAMSLLFTATLGNQVAIVARYLYLAYALVLAVNMVPLARRRDLEARLFVAGFVVLLATGVYDALNGLGLTTRTRTLAFFGMTFFTASLAGILVHRLVNMYQEVQRYARRLEVLAEEKARMVSELHDGLGGIMTNIALLSEVAGRPGTDRREEALSTITSLSQSGIIEIRTFMRSLADRELDWSAVTAEFRHYGVSLLSPHGIALTLQTEIEPEAPPPDSHLHLHLTRIYQEALTNIVKHARATKVEVVVAVNPAAIRLTMVDNGRHDPTPPAASGGHGSRTMAERAQRLGGKLSVSVNGGTRIVVELPPRKLPRAGDGAARSGERESEGSESGGLRP